MTSIHCIESYLDHQKHLYGCFVIEPLDIGHGITIGSAIRRTLLSDLTSFAITGVRINNVKHEFSNVEGVRDDILEILANLKEVIIQSSYFSTLQIKQKYKGFIRVKGPCLVTAGMFFLPKNKFKIVNPNQYICTLTQPATLYIEVDIEKGSGYQLVEEIQEKRKKEVFFTAQPTTLIMDTLFTPIKNANYKIKLIHDTQGNIKESLLFEITTNGSLTPQRSLQEALKIILSLFSPLLISPDFETISLNVKKNTQKFLDFLFEVEKKEMEEKEKKKKK